MTADLPFALVTRDPAAIHQNILDYISTSADIPLEAARARSAIQLERRQLPPLMAEGSVRLEDRLLHDISIEVAAGYHLKEGQWASITSYITLQDPDAFRAIADNLPKLKATLEAATHLQWHTDPVEANLHAVVANPYSHSIVMCDPDKQYDPEDLDAPREAMIVIASNALPLDIETFKAALHRFGELNNWVIAYLYETGGDRPQPMTLELTAQQL